MARGLETMYVLTTIAFDEDGKIGPQHSYGPYTYYAGRYYRKVMMQRFTEEIAAGRIVIKLNKVLDPENSASYIWARK